jgi:DNA-binding transcriptional MerR regulator
MGRKVGKNASKESFIYSFQELNGSAEELTQAATELGDALELYLDSDTGLGNIKEDSPIAQLVKDGWTNFESLSSEAKTAAVIKLLANKSILPGIEKYTAADVWKVVQAIQNDELEDEVTQVPGSEGNERLLRHYVSVDVVDKPSREGREARYGFRHLLQYATARRLLKQGFSLAKIAQYTSVITTRDLVTALLSKSRQSEAELLVAAYKSSTKPAPNYAKKFPLANKSMSKSRDPIHGMADLLRGIEDIRYDFRKDMENLRSVSASLKNLNKVIDQSARYGLEAQNEFMDIVQKMLKTVKETKYEVRTAIEKTTYELTDRIEKSHYEVAHRIDKLEAKIIEHLGRDKE